MAPEILYPNMFKEFYYHKKFRKSIMNKRCSIQKAVLKHFAIFTRYHLCWSLPLIRFIKKKLQHRCFPVNFARFLRASFCRTFVNSCLNVFLHEKDLYRKWIRRFLKNKIRNHSKIQLDEKNLPFHVLANYVFLYFFTARQAAFTSEQLDQWGTNLGSMEKLS